MSTKPTRPTTGAGFRQSVPSRTDDVRARRNAQAQRTTDSLGAGLRRGDKGKGEVDFDAIEAEMKRRGFWRSTT